MSTSGRGWVEDTREDPIFESDKELVLVKGLGKKMQNKLNEGGITNMGEL